MDASWTVYIVECADLTLYTGVARSVTARVIAHNLGKGAKYTRGRLPVELCYQEPGLTHADALRRERAIKRLSRPDKLALIRNAPPGGVLTAATA